MSFSHPSASFSFPDDDDDDDVVVSSTGDSSSTLVISTMVDDLGKRHELW